MFHECKTTKETMAEQVCGKKFTPGTKVGYVREGLRKKCVLGARKKCTERQYNLSHKKDMGKEDVSRVWK